MSGLFVVSAPSGAGKTTLCRGLSERMPGMVYSVSYTTRAPRPGESDGRHYHFISREEFMSMIEAGEFLEWAEVFDRYYGTGRRWVDEQLAAGRSVLVDVDVEGARQIKSKRADAVLVFVVPPAMSELAGRLEKRGTDTPEQIAKRLETAVIEIEAREMYDYLVINNRIEEAVDDFAAIVRADGLRMGRYEEFWKNFFDRQRKE